MITNIREHVWSALPERKDVDFKQRLVAAVLWTVAFPLVIGVIENVKNGDAAYPWALVRNLWLGFSVLGLVLLVPVLGQHVYLTLLRVFSIVGFTIGSTILLISFFLMVTPVAFVFRRRGKDPLDLKFGKGAPPAWRERKTQAGARRYYRLF